MKRNIRIGKHTIGENQPTYFIADIAANHDGDVKRAKLLIKLAKEAGADAVKFQHHDVKKYVSDYGFKNLGAKFSHQSKWDKSIFDVYKDAEVPTSWTDELKAYCEELDITFFTTPYDLDMVDFFSERVPAFKIGSGDVAWHSMLEKIAKTGKPVLFATGASTMQEVVNAVNIITKYNIDVVLMQCNTNYTGNDANFKYINLNVIETYKTMYPDMIIGLSDHTHGGVTVLGAVAMGVKVVEKHFTDDTSRPGPDHPFSMDPASWKKMVDDTKLLELALGSPVKKVEDNEKETVILQRRSIRLTTDIKKGDLITMDKIQFQRPCPEDAFDINRVEDLLGKRANMSIENGDYIRLESIQW